MIISEEDKQAVGYTDMREYLVWLARSDLSVRLLALLYPPSVYRLMLQSGEVLRVSPLEYHYDTLKGGLFMTVVALPVFNPELPYLTPHRITDVDPKNLTPIKWPPDARVH